MAISYWDYGSTATSIGTTGTGGYVYGGTSTSTSVHHYYQARVYVRRILVEEPDHWNDEAGAAFCRLVNDETSTGWKVKLRIKGDVQIVDADVEVRSMANFVPLFKQYANAEDRERIVAFYEKYPAAPPESAS